MVTKFLDWLQLAKPAVEPCKYHNDLRSSLGPAQNSHEETESAQKDLRDCINETNENDEHDNADDEDEKDDEDVHPRCDWRTVDAILGSKYADLVSRTCTFDDGPVKEARVFAYKKGLYHAVTFVGVMSAGKITTYVIRVPGHATKEHWTTRDAYMLQREAEIIEYIGDYTSAPVPQVCTYSAGFNNILGHPFIMMTHLPGKSAYSIWFNEESDDAESDTCFRYGDLPSHAVEKKRITFLRSLAKIMTEINELKFPQIGIPHIPFDGSAPATCGRTYYWDNAGGNDSTSREPSSFTQDLVLARPSSLHMSHVLKSDSKTRNYILGARKLLDLIFAQPVFNPHNAHETFTLRHSDLDLQKILVDASGHITGIIDWVRCASAPRCIGAASAPFFLQKDWQPAYLNNLANPPHLGFTTHRYRQIYAAALAQNGCQDAKYTSKSAMYQAAVQCLNDREYGDVDDFLAKVLRCVPGFRGDVKEYIRAFGAGWPAGERLLECHLRVIFEPEMPDSELLREIEADHEAVDWMLAFAYEAESETQAEREYCPPCYEDWSVPSQICKNILDEPGMESRRFGLSRRVVVVPCNQ